MRIRSGDFPRRNTSDEVMGNEEGNQYKSDEEV
jgi:hypothetical protein